MLTRSDEHNFASRCRAYWASNEAYRPYVYNPFTGLLHVHGDKNVLLIYTDLGAPVLPAKRAN